MRHMSYFYQGSSQHALSGNSGHVGMLSNISGPACCQRHPAAARPCCCLGVVVLTPQIWKRAPWVQHKLFECMFSANTWPIFSALNVSAHRLTLTDGLKLLFRFAQMRKVQPKPIASIKENISSNTQQYVLGHIYNCHDNFIEACDVVCQIWVG